MVQSQEKESGDDTVQDKSKLIAIAVIVILFALFLPTFIKSAKLLSPEVAPKETDQEMPAASEQTPEGQDELQKQLVPETGIQDIPPEEIGRDGEPADDGIEENMDDIIPEDRDKLMPEDEFNINLLDFVKLPE